MLRRLLILLCALGAGAATARAQEPDEPLQALDPFLGTWGLGIPH
jgi:hypothetical protein